MNTAHKKKLEQFNQSQGRRNAAHKKRLEQFNQMQDV